MIVRIWFILLFFLTLLARRWTEGNCRYPNLCKHNIPRSGFLRRDLASLFLNRSVCYKVNQYF